MAIDINLDWSGGTKEKPTVTNPATQVNTIPPTQDSLEWELTPAEDGVRITGVKFYANEEDKDNKTNAVAPPYLQLPGDHVGLDVATWKINFLAGKGPRTETTLWYDVLFEDNDFKDLDWDPKLTISPR